MAERQVNLLSLVTGIIALLIGGLYLLDRSVTLPVDDAVVAASGLLALGLTGLAVSVRRLLGGQNDRVTDRRD